MPIEVGILDLNHLKLDPVVGEEKMTKAEKFMGVMAEFIEKAADDAGAEVSLEDGIVKITFDDGTYVDFTEPLPFDSDGNQLENDVG